MSIGFAFGLALVNQFEVFLIVKQLVEGSTDASLALLTALKAENELPMHVRAAIRNGLTPDEIAEVLLHTAVYAGVPAANAAFAIAQRVLEEDVGA